MNLSIRDLSVTTVPQGKYVELTIQGGTVTLYPSEVTALLGLLNGFNEGVK